MADIGFRPTAKLIIKAEGIAIPYVAMYNPTTFSMSHGQNLIEKTVIGNSGTADNTPGKPATNSETNASGSTVARTSTNNPTLNLDLFFDGTGASPAMGAPSLGAVGNAITSAVGVEALIDLLLATLFKINSETHDARQLTLIWGAGLLFKCKAQTATVNYTLINRLGLPLRATVNVSFVGDKDPKLNFLSKLFSPDLTKLHTVKAGDTIYNIAKKEYDDESYYLQIAQANDLKNYRRLKPGMQLILPPIKKDE